MRRWDAIEAFVEVVRQGSFSAAAEKLGVSASHISRRVGELEQHLGLPLLYRTTRSLRLSDAGERYFEQCRNLLDGFVSAERQLSKEQEEPRGSLHITCATTFGERFVAPLLPEFLRRYPRIEIDLHLSNRRVDLIREQFDLAIRLGTLKDSSLLARRLCDRQEHVCASADYLQRHPMPHTLEELDQHNCLLGSQPYWIFQDQGTRREIRVHGSLRTNSGPALVEAVRSGTGLAQLPDYYVEPYFATGELIPVLEHHRYPLSGVWLVYPKTHQQLPRLKLLCDYLIESFHEPPWSK